MVNTTGIQSTPNCANSLPPSLQKNDNGSFSLVSTSVEGCNVTVNFDPRVSVPLRLSVFIRPKLSLQDSNLQYGVHDVPCPGDAATNEIYFRPVVFWFESLYF